MDSIASADDRESEIVRRMQSLIDHSSSSDSQSIDSGRTDFVACLSLLEDLWTYDERRSTDRTDGLTPPGDNGHPSPAEACSDLPRQVGRFQVRRLLGHGGFGIVFLAYDEALDREAALKLPRAEILLSSTLRDRFVREAQAAAVLDHPGIIPIYETGELGPVSYILSAYCKGPTLAQWLKDATTPVPAITAARVVAQLAEAVQHAHDRGILHRDIKPSNVLLEPSDALANGFPFLPRVSDFGLAKRLESTTDETRPGTLLGTPRYMAPEQARGDERSVGVQTDVYALGVILYELLTGTPPFVGASDQETLRKIEYQAPSSTPIRSRGVPRDLETICIKSLEKDPSRRYQSARDLADDLRRFIAGDAVRARPIGSAERFVRWCRRRPLVAALSLGLAFAICAGSITATSQWLRAERNLNTARASADEANRNLKQAEETLLDFAWIVEESALWSEEAVSLRNEVDSRLKQYYDRLEEAPDTKDDAKPIRAAIHSFTARSGALNSEDTRQVDEEFQRALTLWHQVVVANPDSLGYRRASALCLYSYAMFLRDNARAAGSSDGTAEVRELFAATANGHPSNAESLADLATVLLERGNVHFNARENDLARDMHKLGLLAAEELVARLPKEREHAVLAATLSRVLANEERTEGDHDEALVSAQRAREFLEPFVAEAAADRRFNEELAEVYRLIGYQQRFERNYTEAAELLNRSIRLWDLLLAECRDQNSLLRLSVALDNLASSQTAMQQSTEALDTLVRYQAIVNEARTAGPLPHPNLRLFARTCHRLGMLANDLGNKDVARTAFADGAAAYDEASSASDLGLEGTLRRAECHAFLAAHLAEAGDRPAAIRSYEVAVRLLELRATAPDAQPRIKERYRKSRAALERLKSEA